MGFLNKKRSDGVYVEKREAFSKIMPFLMRTRAESLCYYSVKLDITKTREYLQKLRAEGRNYSLFNVIVAASVSTFSDFPRLNRFLAGQRLYDRNDIEICYVIKPDMSIDSDETIVKIKFDKDEGIDTIADKMNAQTEGKRGGEKDDTDKLVEFFAGMPRFIIRAFVALLRFLDYHGMMPRDLIAAVPFYCSVFIANIGSIGMNASFHHLYEFGTCPFFMTIGRIEKENQIQPSGEVKRRMVIDLGLTVDERIVDGFYLSRVVSNLTRIIENPSLMDNDGDKGG